MTSGVSAPGPTGPGAPPGRLLSVVTAVLLVAAVLPVAGCGQQAGSAAAGTPTRAGPPGSPSASTPAAPAPGPSSPAGSPAPGPSSPAGSPAPTGTVALSAADRSACSQLVAHLQQVTQAITASSELLADSVSPQELSQHIGDEAAQLRRAAGLLAQGPVPAPLAATDRDLVAALNAFADDFARASDAASHGDLSAAVDAMTDQATEQRIVDASDTIEETCR